MSGRLIGMQCGKAKSQDRLKVFRLCPRNGWRQDSERRRSWFFSPSPLFGSWASQIRWVKAGGADEFLKQFHFYSTHEAAHDKNSMPGLLCAVLSDDVSMIRTLAKRMADVNLRCHGLKRCLANPTATRL